MYENNNCEFFFIISLGYVKLYVDFDYFKKVLGYVVIVKIFIKGVENIY